MFDTSGKVFAVVNFPEVGSNAIGLLDSKGDSVASVGIMQDRLVVIDSDSNLTWPLGGPAVGCSHVGGPR